LNLIVYNLIRIEKVFDASPKPVITATEHDREEAPTIRASTRRPLIPDRKDHESPLFSANC